MQTDQLVLGIDGGGSKTVAWLAMRSAEREPPVVGRGTSGPSNPQATGFDLALESLDGAVDAAFGEAGVKPEPVAAAVLGLAGSARKQNRDVLRRWADDRRLAQRFRVVTDALPVLVAGSPEGRGVALISGTGSFAFGQSPDGRSARAGGWGYLFGDEGSAYWIALAALRAVMMAADGRGPATQLVPAVLKRLDLREPKELVSAVMPQAGDRAAIAALADLVTELADQGDPPAQQILDDAASELAAMVAAVARKLGFSGGTFPLALAGGVLRGAKSIRDRLLRHLASFGLRPDPVATVTDPVLGAVRLARADAEGRQLSP